MVDTLVISWQQSYIISHNKQKFISQTYNKSNFDRLNNYKKMFTTLKGISAWKIVRIFSLNHKIIVVLVFSDKKETSLREFRSLTLK